MNISNLNCFISPTYGMIIIRLKAIKNTIGILLSKCLLHFLPKVQISECFRLRNILARSNSHAVRYVVQRTLSHLDFEILNRVDIYFADPTPNKARQIFFILTSSSSLSCLSTRSGQTDSHDFYSSNRRQTGKTKIYCVYYIISSAISLLLYKRLQLRVNQ